MHYADLDWDEVNEPLEEETIKALEKHFGVVLPRDYRGCLELFHGAYPRVQEFSVEGSDGEPVDGCLGVLLSADPDEGDNIYDAHSEMESHAHKKIIPIADDGGGNLLCLDFRKEGKPSVCYFQPELGEFTFVAPSFSAFCELLDEPEGDDW
ncbi:MAG: hypothetical protein AUK47_12430 [Deltaproteobacteria bacterium CG2_30_63_29]|nr:MAG: hypothetical protein AUK47_12430 [Deltaproteobacteria bacterium CG2_30_63_29]PJB40985.1 MAG: hypothetical protein CO108_13810 [Deltaproteobacteria bacterium CG_4_9_14_3_um_filter_63_12]